MSCSVDSVDCSRPECRQLCGVLKYFKNLSDCTVVLQWSPPRGDVWYSLGVYAPNDSVELGGGALLMPSECNVRCIELKSQKIVANWGRIGSGLPSLFVTKEQCQLPNDADNAPVTPSDLPETNKPPKKETTKPKYDAWAIVLLFTAAALVGYALTKVALKSRVQSVNRAE